MKMVFDYFPALLNCKDDAGDLELALNEVK